MSIPEESAVDSAAVGMGPPFGIAAFTISDVHPARPAAESTRGRTPFTVADLAVQWSMLGFDHADIARSCREQVAVRVAAGWPQWASAPEQLDLDGVMRELARAQQVLAERTSRSDDCGDDAAQPMDGVWLQELAGRLIRAGWMSGGDRSEPTVAHAVNVAFLDCCIAQRPTPCGPATVELGIIEITL